MNTSFISSPLAFADDGVQFSAQQPAYDDDEEVKIPVANGQTNASPYGWKDLMLRSELLKAIREVGFQFPSEVQRQGITEILKGRNVVCQAKSGTGKTAVFVISMLQLI